MASHYFGAPTTVMEYMEMDAFGVGATPGSVAITLQIHIQPADHGEIRDQLDFLPSIKFGNNFQLSIHLDHQNRFKSATLFSVVKKAESALK
jgi:hypothetical protein